MSKNFGVCSVLILVVVVFICLIQQLQRSTVEARSRSAFISSSFKQRQHHQRHHLRKSEVIVPETVPYSNEELSALIDTIELYSENSPCLTSERCARSWLEKYDDVLTKLGERGAFIEFQYSTNITNENEKELEDFAPVANKFERLTKPMVKKFLANCKKWAAPIRRLLYLASKGMTLSDDDSIKLASLSSKLESIYAKAKVCEGDDAESCLSLDPELSDIMATSRNYTRLLWAWQSWHNNAGRPMRSTYTETVALRNKGARDNGFSDLSEEWILDFENEQFERIMDNLFEQIKPLYEQLHCYVRRKLSKFYEADIDKSKHDPKLIQAHLLGNMWAQGWENIYDLVKPYPNEPELDLTDYLRNQNYTAMDFFKQAEKFFVSMGLFEMTPTFWAESMIAKPSDRDVQCHASATDLSNGFDYRIKMCTNINGEDFYVVHHEMGHIEYYMAYKDQPAMFRSGANSGFHEAIGDTIALAVMTPKHLKAVGILDSEETSREQDINFLMKIALQKIAFLPFGYLMDKWRWNVFRGNVNQTNYNTKWWQMRREFQGLEPAVDRDEHDFDPGAKYHIASYTPYARYFVSHFHQFQFYKAMCSLSDHRGDLHKCDFYNSKEAGAKLKEMLALGTSHHWTHALEVLTGESELSAQPIFEYFEPLITWLEKENDKALDEPGW